MEKKIYQVVVFKRPFLNEGYPEKANKILSEIFRKNRRNATYRERITVLKNFLIDGKIVIYTEDLSPIERNDAFLHEHDILSEENIKATKRVFHKITLQIIRKCEKEAVEVLFGELLGGVAIAEAEQKCSTLQEKMLAVLERV